MNTKTKDPDRVTVFCVCVLLAVLVAIVFGQTVHFSFIHYDDPRYVFENAHVTGGLKLDAIKWAFTHKEFGLWDPLIAISHMADWQIYGANAGGHHLTNVLLHLASVILLFLILQRMTGCLWRSALVAAVFAIHPLHVESVAWISERKDVLSGLFFMLTLAAYVHYVERPGLGRYLILVVLFALGLMSKAMLVSLPFVLLLLDYWPLERLFRPLPSEPDSTTGTSPDWHAIAEKIPLLALSSVLSIATLMGPGDTQVIDISRVPFWARLEEAPINVLIYMRQMIWPARLAIIYTRYEEGLPWWPVALSLLILISLSIYFIRRRHPYLWMGWLWNLMMLAPVSGIIQLSRHSRADHYNYLPQIGLAIGIVWTAADCAMKWRHGRLLLGYASGAVLLALVVTARAQTSCWQDDFTLWTQALNSTENNYVAHNNLGMAFLQSGRQDEAVAQFRDAIRIKPSLVEAHVNLGDLLIKLGNTRDGIAELREAIRLNPSYAGAYDDLGVALFRQGKAADGITQIEKALNLNPSSSEFRFNLGAALLETGRTDAAISDFREAIRLTPGFEKAHYLLGKTLLQQGRANEGITQLQEALKENPRDANARSILDAAFFKQGRTGEADSNSP